MAVRCNRLLRPTATAVPAAACRPSMIDTGYHALYRGSLFQSKSEDAMFAKTYHATHPDMMDCVDNDDLRDRYQIGEHTSELQSLMRISYAVFCLKKKQNTKH